MIDDFKYMFGIKMRLFPSHQQEKTIWKNFHMARFIYNQLLANSYTDSAIHKVNKQYPNVKRLTGLQRIKHNGLYPWIKEPGIDSLALCNAEINYKAAWKMFHKVHEAGTPNFKRKYNVHQSYSTNAHYQTKFKGQESIFNSNIKFLDSEHLKLPKLGSLHILNSINLPTKQRIRIATVTISTDGCGYYVSLLIKSDQPLRKALAKVNQQIGIDLNTENFLMTSSGETIANPRYYRHAKLRLAREQRILSRRYRVAKKMHKKIISS